MILECKPIFYSHKIFILNIINSLIIYFLFIRINALTLLVTIISLSDSNQRNEGIRLKEIYSLFDFNKVGDISCDELTVLLTTIHASYGFILNTKSTIDAKRFVFYTLEEIKHLLNSLNIFDYEIIDNDVYDKEEYFIICNTKQNIKIT